MPAGTVVASGNLVSPGGQQGIPGAQGVAPTGSIVLFAVNIPPTGWLNCDGSAVSRTTYSALFAVLGITYGTGDGSTTFNLPDLRGRTAIGVGQGTGLTNRALAASGGEETHQLTIAELASHTHIQNAHSHNVYYQANAAAGSAGTGVSGSGTFTGGNTTATTATNQNTGGDGAHNTMPPFLALNYIIKT